MDYCAVCLKYKRINVNNKIMCDDCTYNADTGDLMK